jgi:hypothetical protein
MSKSVVTLIDEVHGAAVATGMDVSPEDVAFIMSLFFEGMAEHDESPVNAWLQMMADECSKVRNEG